MQNLKMHFALKKRKFVQIDLKLLYKAKLETFWRIFLIPSFEGNKY
jgi:hypothetical protein